ncbi:FHA domain-containing protein, partial [Kineococcus sp. R8]|uniref:FHA domain-containing protein n=1 Tax=Kineococcus siccus TaxID=2696567 RepID=UPI001411D04C|nr:FHA domain-containing protein [Kineococcus siccus]
MLLRLTVVAGTATTADPVDVDLDVPAGTTLGEVRAEVEQLTGAWSGPLRVGAATVAADSPLGVAPLLHGAVLRAAPAREPADRPARPTVRVHVAGGPDAGAHLDLAVGEHLVGRRAGPAGGTALADPALSREHALLLLTRGAGHHVRDLGSTNGTDLLTGGRREAQQEGERCPEQREHDRDPERDEEGQDGEG